MIHVYLIPTYNEEGNLQTLYQNLIAHQQNGIEYFYLFVDDCSSDQSVQILEELFSELPHKVITKERNHGPGHSFNLGFEFLLKKYREKTTEVRVITMEADNTSDIEILDDMISISDLGYDLVLASIYAQGGGFSETTFIRKVLSFGANMLFRSVFNIKTLTLSSFYRVYHLSLLKKIKQTNQDIIRESGFICMLEVLLKSVDAKARIIEVPMMLHSDKRVGKSKMKILSNSLKYLQFLWSFKFR